MKLLAGKLNLSMGGIFGSEGKALQAQYIASINHVDLAISDAATNAGHTFYYHGHKHIAKHVPVSGVIRSRCTIYLVGAIIKPDLLLKELEVFDIDHSRVCIHPRCAIIEDEDVVHETDLSSSVSKIASTQNGVGSALVRKIARGARLAKDVPELSHMIKELDIQEYLDMGLTALMEVPQGFDLSLTASPFYPYCTSRDITVSAALSDAQVHPSYLGNVAVCIRTYPIRVGNIMDGEELVGYSGPFYEDSKEISWDDLGVEPEITTVTGRVRRVATFSKQQYDRMLKTLRPDYIMLNFMNYLSEDEIAPLLDSLPEVTHLSFGPEVKDVILNHGYF